MLLALGAIGGESGITAPTRRVLLALGYQTVAVAFASYLGPRGGGIYLVNRA